MRRQVYRVFCAKCAARTTADGMEAARDQAERHAVLTGHWGKVTFWALGQVGQILGPVRVVYSSGVRWLQGRRLQRVSA